MRKIKLKLLLPLVGLLSVTSCGYGLNEIYKGNAYNSPVFDENYYRIWNKDIDPSNSDNKIVGYQSRRLDVERDLVFTNYYSDLTNKVVNPYFSLLEEKADELAYTKDYADNKEELIGVGYGPTMKMSRFEESFKYGYLSKLFDGQMFCNGNFQLARVQIDENGFGTLFDKEGVLNEEESPYFALNFKSSVDYTNLDHPVKSHLSSFDLKISFYLRTTDGFRRQTYVHSLSDIPTNFGEGYGIYTFFGFRLNPSEVSRIQGISIEYENVNDEYTKNYGLDHSLMLYEMFLVDINWN